MNRNEPIDIAEYFNGPQSKANKYGVAPRDDRTLDGRTYASKSEMLRARELWTAPQGMFRWIVEQPVFLLGVSLNVYRADFMYADGAGRIFVEDVKGKATPKFLHDVKLWRQYGRLPLVLLERSGNGWSREVIDPSIRSGDKRP